MEPIQTKGAIDGISVPCTNSMFARDIILPCMRTQDSRHKTSLKPARLLLNPSPIMPALSQDFSASQHSLAMSVSGLSIRSASSTSSGSSDGLPFPSNKSEFEVEQTKSQFPTKSQRRRQSSDRDSEAAFRACVSMLVSSKARRVSVSGKIPVDPSNLILFFRSKVGLVVSIP